MWQVSARGQDAGRHEPLRVPSLDERSDYSRREIRQPHMRRNIVSFDTEPLSHRVDCLVAPRHQGVASCVSVAQEGDDLTVGLFSDACGATIRMRRVALLQALAHQFAQASNRVFRHFAPFWAQVEQASYRCTVPD